MDIFFKALSLDNRKHNTMSLEWGELHKVSTVIPPDLYLGTLPNRDSKLESNSAQGSCWAEEAEVRAQESWSKQNL